MTRKTTEKIFRDYARHEGFQDEVRSAFEEWAADEEGFEEKNQALKVLWDETDTSPAPSSILENPIELTTGKRRVPRRLRAAWITFAAAAAVAVAAVVTAYSISAGHDENLIASEFSKGNFTLPDGTAVCLNRGSRLTYDHRFNRRKRVVTLEGEAYFDVAKNKEKPFIVKTPELDVTVLGTQFTVSAYEGNRVTTYLEEGSVKVSARRMQDMIIIPGQCVTRGKGGDWEVSSTKAENHTSWKNEKLVLEDVSLEDIADCFSHWYGIRLNILTNKSVLLTMTIKNESLDEILPLIGELTGIRWEWQDGTTVNIY